MSAANGLGRVDSDHRARVLCDICGSVVVVVHCKLKCTVCGYARDCSDPYVGYPGV